MVGAGALPDLTTQPSHGGASVKIAALYTARREKTAGAGDTQPSHQHTKARSSPHGQSAPSSLQHAQTPRKHSTNDPYTHHTHQQEHGHCRRHSPTGAQAPETHSQATSTRKRAAAHALS